VDVTLKELKAIQKDQLDTLLEKAGGTAHLSRMLKMHYMVIVGWKQRGKISKKGAELVEKHPALGSFFKAIDLRPDL